MQRSTVMASNLRTSQTHQLKIDLLPIPGVSGIVGMTLRQGKFGDSVYSEPGKRDFAEESIVLIQVKAM